MKRVGILFVVCALSALFIAAIPAIAKEGAGKDSVLSKRTTNDDTKFICINNLFNMYQNNGGGSYNFFTGNSGLEYPKGTGNTVVFEDGLVWGGRQNGSLKCGGSTYRYGLQAGRILVAGPPGAGAVAADPADAHNRLYAVRRDITPSTPSDVAEEALAEESRMSLRYMSGWSVSYLRERYVRDWNDWPANEGAPFEDVNHDGQYDPAVDIPGFPGADATLWYVSNDLDGQRTRYLYGSDPMGFEMQRTIWAYNQPGALGNTLFVRTVLVNKSGSAIDSMYLGQWADPDLGDAGDDLNGADTSRTLVYVYNGRSTDSYYGKRIPAVGYRYLQTPVVPGASGDTANFMGRRLPGFRNLPLCSANNMFKCCLEISEPSLGIYSGTIGLYNALMGLQTGGGMFIDPSTNLPTSFVDAGDPISRIGWIDGLIHPPGDRRVFMSTGPITFAAGDTQDVVIAVVVSPPGDHIYGIRGLQLYADQVQSVYRNGFVVTTPPPPLVRSGGLDAQIVLDWSEPSLADSLEAFAFGGYRFQGYNVYQAASATGDGAVRRETYDIVDNTGLIVDACIDPVSGTVVERAVQFGQNNGVCRFYATSWDTLTNTKLANYRPYYFAVTAYFYNPAANPKVVETIPRWVTIDPEGVVPGSRYGATVGQSIPADHVSGHCDGDVRAAVVNPLALTGHRYRVSADTGGGQVRWTVTDSTAGQTLLAGRADLNGTISSPVVDGLLILTPGSGMTGMKDYSIPSGTRRWTWAYGADSLKMEGFNGAIGNAYQHWYSGSTVPLTALKNVQIRFGTAWQPWNPDSAITDPNYSFAYRYLRNADQPATKSSFAPYIIHAASGMPYQAFKKSVPFSAWDMESTPPRRLAVGHLENNVAAGLVDGVYFPPWGSEPAPGGDNGTSAGPQEWFFIFDADYSETPDPSLQIDIQSSKTAMMWVGTPALRSNHFLSGDEFDIAAFHPPTPNDVYSFTAPANITGSPELERQDAALINVFPNPYFGLNLNETSKYQRFVTITHLPRKAVIRIWTLGGHLVRTYVKDDDLQTLRWDLLNSDGIMISSGMYLIRIELPELGIVRHLKLAVIVEAQILDHL